MKKDSLIPVRVNIDLKNQLEAEAKKDKITLNALANKILQEHVSIISPFHELGWGFISKSLMARLFDHFSDEELIKMAKNETSEEITLIEYKSGEFNYENVLIFLTDFLEMYNLPYRISKNNGEEIFINHEMGRKWALFYAVVFENLLNKLDYKITRKKIQGSILSLTIKKE